ncbi:hypothetical protein MKW92_006153 [Papaver armeniacum]|nr:hypothetical protein MKW92_006153 [Papaver armeniacum]
MGALCCCLRADQLDEYVNPNNTIFRSCLCLGCILNAYTALFRRDEMHPIPSAIESTATLTSQTSNDDSLASTYRSPPSQKMSAQHASKVSNKLFGNWYFSIFSLSNIILISLSIKVILMVCLLYFVDSIRALKWVNVAFSAIEKRWLLRINYANFLFTSTCRIYSGKPKILTQCSHHYHLVCIYEWMERSETCPVCGKVMVFNETS